MLCQDYPWPQRGKLKHIIDMKQLVEWLAYAGFMLLVIGFWLYVVIAFFCVLFNQAPSIKL